MYKDVTDKFKEDSMMCAGGADRDACQVNLKSSENYGTHGILLYMFFYYTRSSSFITSLVGRFRWTIDVQCRGKTISRWFG